MTREVRRARRARPGLRAILGEVGYGLAAGLAIAALLIAGQLLAGAKGGAALDTRVALCLGGFATLDAEGEAPGLRYCPDATLQSLTDAGTPRLPGAPTTFAPPATLTPVAARPLPAPDHLRPGPRAPPLLPV